MAWNLGYSFLELPELLYTRQGPTQVEAPRVTVFNHALAQELGLGGVDDASVLSGSFVPSGVQPFAQAYAGHQYGHFTMLGDGRALVLGEHRGPDGRLYDLQLKGSGRTPYSRSGDGRAALGPMLREYVMGEAMHALGIPTTRALAVVETGETVWRETPLPGAVLTRVAQSHLRVGTFEYVAATEDLVALKALTDYAVQRHYPQAASAENPTAGFLEAVLESQARLVAQWMSVGFVHGVMNTDNMAVSGQTIDYGPCAFLDTYKAGQVFSSIDRRGRYAYANQPGIARWNLTRFAEALLPVLHADPDTSLNLAQGLIDSFAERYERHYLSLMAAKLGLAPSEGTAGLVERLLACLEQGGADYTLTFRRLTDAVGQTQAPAELAAIPGLEEWYSLWRNQLSQNPADSDFAARQTMAAANPVYIPRNHLVEEALQAASAGDLEPFHLLVSVLSQPFVPQPGRERYASGPDPQESAEPYVTYCGT